MKNIIKSIINSMFNFFGLQLYGIEKKDVFHDQKMLLKGMEAAVIFDVGAYIGQVTAKYKYYFPGSTIYAFEPFPESFKKLQKEFKWCDSVKPYRLAVAGKSGTEEFYVNPDESRNSLLPQALIARKYCYGIPENTDVIKVDVTTIDDFCKKELIPKIHILKLDIEGSELTALRGASEKLAHHSIELIYTEIMFVPHYEGGPMFYELCSFLSNFNYTLFNVYNLKRAVNRQLRWGNAIFVSPDIRANKIDVR